VHSFQEATFFEFLSAATRTGIVATQFYYHNKTLAECIGTAIQGAIRA
jgi:hypothetical protein